VDDPENYRLSGRLRGDLGDAGGGRASCEMKTECTSAIRSEEIYLTFAPTLLAKVATFFRETAPSYNATMRNKKL
jgi:hypothetical protein